MPQPKTRTEIYLEPEDNTRLAQLCGQLNQNILFIEGQMGVEICMRGAQVVIIGKPKLVNITALLLKKLYEDIANKGEDYMLSEQEIHLSVKSMEDETSQQTTKGPLQEIPIQHLNIKARTANQSHYIKSLKDFDINFGVGPSGTGKTFLAVAYAAHCLEQELVKRIILVRPAVEAGEKLGFLPGDLTQKVDPYLRPLYDALYFTLGSEKVHRLIENNIIEVAPLAFMRGRTLNDSFVILDEGQNTTIEQMKMFLTRIGFGSQAVITGDITQVDLPKHTLSGLRHSINVLEGLDDVKVTFFRAEDVVRHPLVQKIIYCYEKFEGDTHRD